MSEYTINDRNGETRIEGTIDPDPAFTGGTITKPLVIDIATAAAGNVVALKSVVDDLPNLLAQLKEFNDGTIELRILSDGTGEASIHLGDNGTLDGILAIASNGSIFSQPRSTAADADVMLELADKLGADRFVTHANGAILLPGLPTSDPGVPGQLFSLANVLHVSP